MSGAATSARDSVPVYAYCLDDAHFRVLFDRSRARKAFFCWRSWVPIVLLLAGWVVLRFGDTERGLGAGARYSFTSQLSAGLDFETISDFANIVYLGVRYEF